MAFDNGVSAPGGVSYAAPLLSFQQFANWAADDPFAAKFKEQDYALGGVKLQQAQRMADIQKQLGTLNWNDPAVYSKAAALISAMGQPAEAASLLERAPQGLSPMFPGGGAPTGGGGGGPAPSASPSPRVPVQQGVQGVQGDSGSGTIASLVTDRFPNQDEITGKTIAKIVSVMGIDANAPMSPGQILRVQGLLKNPKYAPPASGAPQAEAPATASQRVASAFGALPPSANAGTPAPTPSPQPGPRAAQAAPIGAGAGQAAPPVAPQQGAPQPQAVPQATQPQQQPQMQAPAQEQGQPIVPQVPLPKGYTDPQAAILALRTEAARLARYPREKGQVAELENWANRIEDSLKPVQANPNTTMLDPRTGKVLYEGPAAAALRATETAGGSPTLDADAERYRQTGQLPPNLKSNLMGQAESRMIRQRAQELEREAGGDPAAWPQKWQQFKGQQVAIQRFTSGPQGNTIRSFNVLVDHLDTLSEAAEGLKNGDNRILNRFVNNWKAATGDPAPTNFDGIKALVGDEVVKAVVGSAGALADREEVKKDLDRASSPQQLAQLVEKYKKLALGQLHGLQKQYETSTGLKNFGDMLLPGTLKALGGAAEGKKSDASGTVSKDGWVVVTAPQEITE